MHNFFVRAFTALAVVAVSAFGASAQSLDSLKIEEGMRLAFPAEAECTSDRNQSFLCSYQSKRQPDRAHPAYGLNLPLYVTAFFVPQTEQFYFTFRYGDYYQTEFSKAIQGLRQVMDQYQLTDDYVSCIQFKTPTYVPGNFGYESRNEVENKRFAMMCTQYWDAHQGNQGIYDIIEGKLLKVEVRKK